MALQVWLPLTKDLRNQGLKNVSAVVNGTTSFTAGKLGQALNCNGLSYWSLPGLTVGTVASIACWSKTSTNGKMQWVLESSVSDRLNLYESNIYTLNTGDGNNNPFQTDAGANINCLHDGEWHHFVVTWDDSTCKLYIDGIYKGKAKTYRSPASGNSTRALKIAGGYGNAHSYDWNGAINDFRLYDHCLSPMEVKKLSQGLVLHYPLNRNGWGQENLMPGTYRADGNNGSKIYGWENNGFGTPEIVTKDESKCIHLQASCSNATTPSIRSASKLLLENGVEYTVSCDLMYDKEIKVTNSTPVHYHNGSTNSTDPFNMTNVNNGKGFSWKSIKPASGTIIPANTWQHYEMRFTALATPSDSSLPYSTYRAFIYGSVRTVSETTTVNMWLKNWKIEKGSIATPWCPNSSDALATTMGLNSTTEYDTSGFCNNGTWHGTHTNTSDTPKYTVSTTATGGETTYLEGPVLPTEAQTAALWIKSKKSQNAAIFNDKTTGLQIGLLNSLLYMNSKTSTAGFTTTHWKDDDWNHVVVTYDGTTRKAYINGQTETQSGASNYYIHNADNCWLWNRSYNNNYPFNGSLSDFRIYATALSASDVKSLYQNCATIDADGTIHGQIRS